MKVKSRISSADLFFVLVQTMVGVSLLSLPYDTYQTAGSDGWISILISGIFVQLIVLLIWLLCRKFPNLTLFDFSKVILGRIPGTVINMLYIIYFLAVVCSIFIVFTDTVKQWILPETPAWVLFLIGIALLIYGSACTIKNFVALCSFLFLFIFFLIFISFFVYRDLTFDVRYLFPVGSSGGWNILKGTSDTVISFLGFETLLIYFAFIKQPKRISTLKGALLGVLFTTILFMYIVIISTMMLSPEEMKNTSKPVLYILSVVSIHVLSRLDLIFLSIWSPVILMTIISYSFSAGMGISKVFHINYKIAAVLFGSLVFIISIIFYYMDITVIEKWLKQLSLIFCLVIPIILLLITIVFKKEAASVYEKN